MHPFHVRLMVKRKSGEKHFQCTSGNLCSSYACSFISFMLKLKILMTLFWTPCLNIFLFLEWGRTHSLDMGAANGPVVPAPGGRLVNREHWRNDNWQEIPEYSEKNRSQCHFAHKNHISTVLEKKPGLRGEKPGGITRLWATHMNTVTVGNTLTITLSLYLLYFEKWTLNIFPHTKLLSFKRNHFSRSRLLMHLVVRTCIPPCNKHFTIKLPARVPRRLR